MNASGESPLDRYKPEGNGERHVRLAVTSRRVLIHVNAERIGGTETHVYHLCGALRASGVEVAVTGLRSLQLSPEWRDELTRQGVQILAPPAPSALLPAKLVPVIALLRLLVVLRRRQFDCLVGQGLGAAFLHLRWFLKPGGLLVWHEHGAGGRPTEEGYAEVPGSDAVRKFTPRLRRVLAAVHGVIVGSDVARDNLINIQEATQPIRVIPPLDRVRTDRLENLSAFGGSGTLRVIHIGRIAERKGVEELMRVWGDLRIGDVELHLYGPISKWAGERLPAWRQIPGVHFHGALDRDALPGVIASASFGVIPSMCEGFGLAAYEFMAFGLPFVMTKTGAAREFGRDNPDCIICERSISALREAIGRMAHLVRTEAVSPARLRALWSSRYSFEQISRDHVMALTSKESWIAPGLVTTEGSEEKTACDG